MCDFFRGWKRKAGCVTLILVLSVMAAWVRSFTVVDSIEIGERYESRYFASLASIDSSMKVGIEWGPRVTKAVGWQLPHWETYAPCSVDSPYSMPSGIEWTYRSIGFRYIAYSGHPTGRLLIAEDWAIILPLTLLSAYLLLSKPRLADNPSHEEKPDA